MCSWVEDGLPAGGRLCTGARNPCESPVEQRCFQPTARSTAMKAAYRETDSRTDVSPRCRPRYGLPSRLFRLCDTTASCCCGARHGRAFQLSVIRVSVRCRASVSSPCRSVSSSCRLTHSYRPPTHSVSDVTEMNGLRQRNETQTTLKRNAVRQASESEGEARAGGRARRRCRTIVPLSTSASGSRHRAARRRCDGALPPPTASAFRAWGTTERKVTLSAPARKFGYVSNVSDGPRREGSLQRHSGQHPKREPFCGLWRSVVLPSLRSLGFAR